MPKKLTIFGATGSIGRQTLEVLRKNPLEYELLGMSAWGSQPDVFEEILEEFQPKFIALASKSQADYLQDKYSHLTAFGGKGALRKLLLASDLYVMNAVSGVQGLHITLAAAQMGKHIFLANKESLVMAGEQLQKIIKKSKAVIYPIDSETTGTQRILDEYSQRKPKKIYLLASGGPFWDANKWPLERLESVSSKDALAHPIWSMGPKISIDSATLMNKAFELIEFVRFFNFDPQKIEVLIHPEVQLHSIVDFGYGKCLAQVGPPNMRPVIEYALSEREKKDVLPVEPFSFEETDYTLLPVDAERFPSIQLARNALKKGEGMCRELCRKNELAVEKFLRAEIGFREIFAEIS